MFILMPMMHSENKADAAACVKAFTDAQAEAKKQGNEAMEKMLGGNIKFALSHKEPIDKFGRYPSRNAALGRESTAEEVEYLKTANTWGQGGKKEEEKDDKKEEK